jgi:hypothetical protein
LNLPLPDVVTGACYVERGDAVYGNHVRAARAIAAGEHLFDLDGSMVAAASRHTIQLATDRHLVPADRMWAFLNHGCMPNVRVDVVQRRVVAIAPIAAGAELRFNYNTTEWKLAAPFSCACAAGACSGEIRGFAWLDAARRAAIRDWLAPHLLERFDRFG